MLIKKLLEILRSLDKSELKKFRKFISSDYFNTNESIVKLFKLIAKSNPEFELHNSALEPETMFKGIYGARKYDEKTLRYLLSSLYNLAEKFLAITSFESSSLEIQKSVIDFMIERRLYSLASRNLKAAEETLEKNFLIGGENIRNKVDYGTLWHQMYFLASKQEPIMEKRTEQAEYHLLSSVIEFAHNYQIIFVVSHSYNIPVKSNLLFEYVKNVDYRRILKYMDEQVNERNYSEHNLKIFRVLKIYMCFMITILEEKDEVYFDRMNSLVEEYSEVFQRTELQNLHVMLTTCCMNKRKAISEDKYLRIYFDVIKRGVSRNLYTSYTSQYMDVSNFINIFKTALQLKENDWAAEFLRNYGERIPPEYSEDVINYSFAELFFTKGNFERSLTSLSRVKQKLFRLRIPAKVLTLRLYFELNYFEEAFYLIDSFAHFLSANTKIREDEKINMLRFLGYYRDILKVKTGSGSPKLKHRILRELREASLLPHKEWLMEKIREL